MGDDHGLVRKAHRHGGAALDAGRAVADHPVEAVAQIVDDLADALFRQRVLVAGLRGRQQPEILQPLVADQRLRQLCDTLHHVDEIEHDAAFGAHDEVEVAQADVEIDDDDLVAALRQRSPQRGGRRGLADPALA
ncbi:hypothetical protein ACVWZ3_003328 [Bradyrhizobium sp. i1.3.6]